MEFIHFKIGKDDDGRRLDRVIRKFLSEDNLSQLYKSLRKGLIKDSDIDKAIEYQRLHKGIKLGEAFHILQVCNDQDLINTIGEVIGFKAVQLDPKTFKFNFLILFFLSLLSNPEQLILLFQNYHLF